MGRKCSDLITVVAEEKLPKAPTDSRTYYMNFDDEIQAGDTIATVVDVFEETSYGNLIITTASKAVLAADTVVNGKQLYQSRAATCPISGGAVDSDGNAVEYKVGWTITTASGETITKYGILVLTKK